MKQRILIIEAISFLLLALFFISCSVESEVADQDRITLALPKTDISSSFASVTTRDVRVTSDNVVNIYGLTNIPGTNGGGTVTINDGSFSETISFENPFGEYAQAITLPVSIKLANTGSSVATANSEGAYYGIKIHFEEYQNVLKAEHISAILGTTTRAVDSVQIYDDVITVSSSIFTNTPGDDGSLGELLVTPTADYTISRSSLPVDNPVGTDARNSFPTQIEVTNAASRTTVTYKLLVNLERYYESPLQPSHISANFADTITTEENIKITEGSLITISGLTNAPGVDGTGTVTIVDPTGYTVSPKTIPIPNPAGSGVVNDVSLDTTITVAENGTDKSFSYSVKVNFDAYLTPLKPSDVSAVFSGVTTTDSDIQIRGRVIFISGLTNTFGVQGMGTVTVKPIEAGSGYIVISGSSISFQNPYGTYALYYPLLTKVVVSGPTGNIEYSVVIKFRSYIPVLKKEDITATFDGKTATVDDIQIEDDIITISGFIANAVATGSIVVNPSGGKYTVASSIPSFPDSVGDVIGPITLATPLQVTDVDHGTTVDYNIVLVFRSYPVFDPTNPEHLHVALASSLDKHIIGLNITVTETSNPREITVSGLVNSGITGNDPFITGKWQLSVTPVANIFTVSTGESISINDPAGIARMEVDYPPNDNDPPAIVVTNIYGGDHEEEVTYDLKFIFTEGGGNFLRLPGSRSPDAPNNGTLSMENPCETLLDANLELYVNGVLATTTHDLKGLSIYYDRRDPTGVVISDDGNFVTNTQTVEVVEKSTSSISYLTFSTIFPACLGRHLGDSKTGRVDAAYELSEPEHIEVFAYLSSVTQNSPEMFYKLTQSIDLGTVDANGNGYPWALRTIRTGAPSFSSITGPGFRPIEVFLGNLDCTANNNTISNLYINRSSESGIGFFKIIRSSAKVSGCGLENVDIIGGQDVGGLAGENQGTITKSYVRSGTVQAMVSNAGGLIGKNEGGVIEYSYANVDVGRVHNDQGAQATNVGGLVGANQGAYAFINNSYSSGPVTGVENVGGLVGLNSYSGYITSSYSSSSATGNRNVGGFIGTTYGFVSYVYATGQVASSDRGTRGGLIGQFVAIHVDITYDRFLTFCREFILPTSRVTTVVVLTASYWPTDGTAAQNAITPPILAPVGRVVSGAEGLRGEAITDILSDLDRTKAQMQNNGPTDTPNLKIYENWGTRVWDFTAGQYPRLNGVVCANRQGNADATTCTDI